jgi:hypothetical protein
MRLRKHHVVRTDINASQTPRAGFGIHPIDTIDRLNGSLRAVVGTHPALVTKMDAEIARSRKTSLDPQEG